VIRKNLAEGAGRMMLILERIRPSTSPATPTSTPIRSLR
jgi:hypothetical protein